MEDRVLFSAAPIPDAAALDAAVDLLMATTLDAHPDAAISSSSDRLTADAAAPAAVSRELVFVDTSAEHYQQLVDDLLNNADETRELELYLLDAERDGIQQISEVLANYTDLDTIHIVSHGDDGTVQLGSTWLNVGTLGAYAGEIAGWNDALAGGADLLFYGCNLASNHDGQTLVEALATLTDADVAASTDLTGSSLLGGDWDLEYTAGSVESTVAFSSDVQTSWYSLLGPGGWLYRQQLTFDNSAQTEDLDDFPVLVHLDITNFNFSLAEANGEDIRFYDANDVTPLKYEIESWDAVAQEADIWVKVPVIDSLSSSDFIWMYYGNAGASDAQDAAAVWDVNYGGVWHLNEDVTDGQTTGTHFDSTANDNDGTQNENEDSTGQISQAQLLDGSNDYIDVGNGASVDITGTQITVEAWINANSWASAIWEATILDNHEWGSGRNGYVMRVGGGSNGEVEFQFGDGTNWHAANSSIANMNTNEWYYLVASYDGSNVEVFVNGNSEDMTSSSATISSSASNLNIGRNAYSNDRFFDGLIDETRVSNTARSTDWIAAQYASMSGSFITHSAAETVGATPVANLWIVDEATTITQGYAGTLASPDTIGSFNNTFDLAPFGAAADVNALHYVGSTINMSGFEITAMTLNPGDLILSVDGSTTVDGLSVNNDDLFVFQPATAGDYGSGSFTMLRENLGLDDDITAFTLIENNTTVPIALEPSGTLQQGSFLYSAGTGAETRQLRYYDLATGGNSIVIDGDVNDNNGFKPGANVISGVDLVETNMTVGGRSFIEGQILMSLTDDDVSIGTNIISVADQDIFVLTPTDTTTWTAEIAFDGAQAGFSGDVHGLTFAGLATNNPPMAVDDSGPLFTTDADTSFTSGNVLGNDSDPDVSDILSVASIDTTGTVGLVTDNGDGTFGYDPNGQFSSLGAGSTATDTFVYTVDDGNGGADTATVTITITGVNAAPVASDDAYSTSEGTPLNVVVPGSWFNASWSARQKLTFDNLAQTENLADFPVLVQLEATRIDYSKTQDAGEDLRFVDGSGTVLDHEIESWDESGTSYVWVKVPEVLGSSNSDFIWMYYDNPIVSDGQNAAGVWSSSYRGVYHLNEDPGAGGVLADATLNTFDATNQGTTDAGGVISNGQAFDAASSQYIDLGADRAFLNNVSAATLSAW
ncbi:MAG: DUF2341 domain-containing protein, partial [Planctomycetota bacterium]|nr:DUF2341 domain-containing protein [Planctomycetota bacterium]